MKKEGSVTGSVTGGVLLIAGSCIGAGMLAIPIVTGLGGFFPSTAMFVFAWAFMTATSFLLLEANLAFGHNLSLISLAEKTLGWAGKAFTWFFFLLLFYSLNVAYIAASGPIVTALFSDILSLKLPTWVGSFLFTFLFAIFLQKGTRKVDILNRYLMAGLVISYLVLVFLGSFMVQSSNLFQGSWKYAFISLPILVVSFGFHNMVPTLVEYFQGDRIRLKTTIFLGSLSALLVYLIWEWVLLGIIPLEGKEGIIQGLKEGEPVTEVLRRLLGRSWVTATGEAFSLFAITTSFLAQSLSFVDFLADGLKVKKVKKERVLLIFLTLIPPFIAAFLYPHLFFLALNMAGGISAVILFGVIPVLMVWVLRYRKKEHTPLIPLLPWGKFMLILIMAISLLIFGYEIFKYLGIPL